MRPAPLANLVVLVAFLAPLVFSQPTTEFGTYWVSETVHPPVGPHDAVLQVKRTNNGTFWLVSYASPSFHSTLFLVTKTGDILTLIDDAANAGILGGTKLATGNAFLLLPNFGQFTPNTQPKFVVSGTTVYFMSWKMDYTYPGTTGAYPTLYSAWKIDYTPFLSSQNAKLALTKLNEIGMAVPVLRYFGKVQAKMFIIGGFAPSPDGSEYTLANYNYTFNGAAYGATSILQRTNEGFTEVNVPRNASSTVAGMWPSTGSTVYYPETILGAANNPVGLNQSLMLTKPGVTTFAPVPLFKENGVYDGETVVQADFFGEANGTLPYVLWRSYGAVGQNTRLARIDPVTQAVTTFLKNEDSIGDFGPSYRLLALEPSGNSAVVSLATSPTSVGVDGYALTYWNGSTIPLAKNGEFVNGSPIGQVFPLRKGEMNSKSIVAYHDCVAEFGDFDLVTTALNRWIELSFPCITGIAVDNNAGTATLTGMNFRPTTRFLVDGGGATPIDGSLTATTVIFPLKQLFGVSAQAVDGVNVRGNTFNLPPALNVPLPRIASVAQAFTSNPISDCSIVAPGSIVTITGTNFVGSEGPMDAPDGDQLPVVLSGTTVSVSGLPSPLLSVSATLITLQIPYEVPMDRASATIVIATQNDAFESAGYDLIMQQSAPCVQKVNSRIVLSSANGPTSTDNPVNPGDAVALLFTGLGQTSPPVPTGQKTPDDGHAIATDTWSLSIEGDLATIQSVALVPGVVGVYQAIFQMPTDLPLAGKDTPQARNGILVIGSTTFGVVVYTN